MDLGVLVITSLIVGVICGFVCIYIASSRGMEGGFLWGFFLGIIGIAIVALKPNDQIQKVSSSITTGNDIDNLIKLSQLKEQGIISEEEFSEMKADCMSKIKNAQTQEASSSINAGKKVIPPNAKVYRFVCHDCGKKHTGWYQKCPHCGANGQMQRLPEEEIVVETM